MQLLRRRGGPFVATLAVHVLLLLAILMMARVPILPKKVEDRLTTFSLTPDPERKAAGNRTKAERAEQSVKAAPFAAPPPPVPPKPDNSIPGILNLSSADFAAADIGKLPKSAAGTGAQGNSRVTVGPGEGPGGVQLFEAEWYRHPSDAELGAYLPGNAPREGWGLIACRTVEQYHVEDCQTLGESPLGSGFAQAVRRAAWQFLVRPPRVDGKPLVGAWVRIRIDYRASGAGAGG